MELFLVLNISGNSNKDNLPIPDSLKKDVSYARIASYLSILSIRKYREINKELNYKIYVTLRMEIKAFEIEKIQVKNMSINTVDFKPDIKCHIIYPSNDKYTKFGRILFFFNPIQAT